MIFRIYLEEMSNFAFIHILLRLNVLEKRFKSCTDISISEIPNAIIQMKFQWFPVANNAMLHSLGMIR